VLRGGAFGLDERFVVLAIARLDHAAQIAEALAPAPQEQEGTRE
jgi:hypothetical protein